MQKEIIGDCTLYLGDCREVLPQLPDFDLILTDPPYNLEVDCGAGAFGKRTHLINTRGFTDDGVDYSFLNEVKNWFSFCSFKQLPELLEVASKCDRSELLTWNKPNPVPTCNNKYLPDVEYIVHGFSKGCLWGGYREKSHFFIWPCGNKLTEHPNEKPLPVIEKLLSVGVDGGTVCDPFMGSGTTGVACVRKDLAFTGIECEEKYFDIACKRIKEAYRTRPRLFKTVERKKPEQLSLI